MGKSFVYFSDGKNMKIAKTALFTAFILASAISMAAGSKTITSPKAGILCDQYACADKNGLSKTLTTQYLGKKQAQKVFGQGEFDSKAFTFANGIFCDATTQKCHVDRYFEGDGKRSAVSKEYTQKLFGKTATTKK